MQIKPIIGGLGYIAERTRFDKEPNIDNKRYHLTLLAKNNVITGNLMKLCFSLLMGITYKPRMDESSAKHSEGELFCLSGCPG